MPTLNDVICEKCQKVLQVSDWPWCPHGKSNLYTVNDDCDVLVRHGICNEDGSPRRYTKKSDMTKEARRRGLENHVVHQGGKGSDKSKHSQRFI
jgi:hypothetical protein